MIIKSAECLKQLLSDSCYIYPEDDEQGFEELLDNIIPILQKSSLSYSIVKIEDEDESKTVRKIKLH